jgi:hypothetical protein
LAGRFASFADSVFDLILIVVFVLLNGSSLAFAARRPDTPKDTASYRRKVRS